MNIFIVIETDQIEVLRGKPRLMISYVLYMLLQVQGTSMYCIVQEFTEPCRFGDCNDLACIESTSTHNIIRRNGIGVTWWWLLVVLVALALVAQLNINFGNLDLLEGDEQKGNLLVLNELLGVGVGLLVFSKVLLGLGQVLHHSCGAIESHTHGADLVLVDVLKQLQQRRLLAPPHEIGP